MDTVTLEIDIDTARRIQQLISDKLANHTRRFELANDREFDLDDAPDWFHGLMMAEIDLNDQCNELVNQASKMNGAA